MIVFSEIIETNAVQITLLADGTYLVRINGNVRTLADAQHLMGMEAFRAARGAITA